MDFVRKAHPLPVAVSCIGSALLVREVIIGPGSYLIVDGEFDINVLVCFENPCSNKYEQTSSFPNGV